MASSHMAIRLYEVGANTGDLREVPIAWLGFVGRLTNKLEHDRTGLSRGLPARLEV